MSQNNKQYPCWLFIAFPAVAMLLGWGLRGYIGGGPFGAMIPGAFLAFALSMLLNWPAKATAVLVVFCAVGIGIGGEMTYGQTLGLLHQTETHTWGTVGTTVKGGVWGLLGGVFVAMGLLHAQMQRKTIIITYLLLLAGMYAGFKLVNQPMLIYFSDPAKPRPESWAALLFGAIAMIFYLLSRLQPQQFKTVVKFAFWGTIGGALGFGLGCQWLVLGKQLRGTVIFEEWWKAMEFSFGLLLGAAFGWAAWLNRHLLSPVEANSQPVEEQSPLLDMLLIFLLAIVIFLWMPAFLDPIVDKGYTQGNFVLPNGVDLAKMLSNFAFYGFLMLLVILYFPALTWQTGVTLTFFYAAIDFAEDFFPDTQMGTSNPHYYLLILSMTVIVAVLTAYYQRGKSPILRLFLLIVWSCVAVAFFRLVFFENPGETEGLSVAELLFRKFFVHIVFALSALFVTWVALRRIAKPNSNIIASKTVLSILFLIFVTTPGNAQTAASFTRPAKHGTYVIAHRGAHKNIPENSLAAYQRAIDLGCDFVEIDVRTTRDGKFISMHNSAVDAYVQGTKGNVKDMTLAEIRKLDIGERIGDAWKGTTVPTLDEILALCKGKIGIYLDLKDAPIADLVQVLQKYNMERDVIWYIPASYMVAIKQLTAYCPDCVVLPDPGPEKNIPSMFNQFKTSLIASDMGQLSASFVKEAQRFGAKVFADEKEGNAAEWAQMIAWGTAGIQTDDPGQLIAYLKQRSVGTSESGRLPLLGRDAVEKVIAAMTPDEKIGLTVGDGKFLPGAAPGSIEQGTGIIIANQNSKLVIPRLGIWSSALSDGPSGLNRDPRPAGATEYTYSTAFPTSTCLAATWNTSLARAVGDALGQEALEYGYDVMLMPALNLHRDPKCGRNFEYYSEDPLLSGKLAAAVVNGLQSQGVGATLKHFIANNQETNRRTYNAIISQRALREIYLRGFEIAVKESNPAAIMTSYNKVNGFYTAENPQLLQDIVRGEWKYQGLFMTDFDGYGSAVAKVRAGNNMLMGGNQDELNELTVALKNHSLDEKTLDKNLEYNLRLKLISPRAKGRVPTMKPDLKAHAAVAREAAAEGMVLLKNDNRTLPFKKVKTVAVFGKISYYLIEAGTGSGGIRSNPYAVSVNEGLKAAGFKVLPNLEESYTAFNASILKNNLVPDYFNNPKMLADNGIKDGKAPGHFVKRLIPFHDEMPMTREQVAAQVKKSDLAVITLGRSGGENYENGYLPPTPAETELVRNVCEVYHAAGKKVVLVLNVGGVWETASWRDAPDAILVAWQPGQEGGHAVADILSGAVNPSGKLPDSFPLKYDDVPSSSTFPGEPATNPINSFYKEGVYVGYRYYNSFSVPTAYEFGYGLSYTSFQYYELKLNSDHFKDKMLITVRVKNTGKVAGKEVVQLYLSAPVKGLDKPKEELKGFAKTKLLQPGESQQLSFELDMRSLASFQEGQSAWIADSGDYKVLIGASCTKIKLSASFNLPETVVVEKVNDALYPNFYMKELKPE